MSGTHRRCLFCGDQIDAVSGTCRACDARPSEDMVSGVDRSFSCPRCPEHARLVAIRVDDAFAFQCDTCPGRFVPAGDWSAMLDRQTSGEHLPLGTFVPPPPGKGLTTKELFADVTCPVCAETMERAPFGSSDDVILDLCRRHGTWFDSGELVRAVQRVHLREVAIEGGEEQPTIPHHDDHGGNVKAFTKSLASTAGTVVPQRDD
ncbi:hypothetical protein BH09MYX1_BH09MYX1_00820 [soil metagenome]